MIRTGCELEDEEDIEDVEDEEGFAEAPEKNKNKKSLVVHQFSTFLNN